MSQDFSRRPYLREALMDRITNGDPYHPSAAAIAQHRHNVVDVLRLIELDQDEYRTQHSEGYACNLNDLSSDDKLALEIRDSHYEVRLLCRRVNDGGYVAYAVPRSDTNPPDSPLYCLDQTKIIRRYAPAHANDITIRTFYQHEPCPPDSENVE